MKLSTTHFKTVQAATPSELDAGLEAAKDTIENRNESARFVELRLTASGDTLTATIIWSD